MNGYIEALILLKGKMKGGGPIKKRVLRRGGNYAYKIELKYTESI